MAEPSFNVKLKNQLVMVRISGDWDIQTDISYLTKLDEVVAVARAKQWAIFADLRGWRVSEEVRNFEHNRTIQIARTNQELECWLVDDVDQGLHIQHHIERTLVPFYKCHSLKEAQELLSRYGYSL